MRRAHGFWQAHRKAWNRSRLLKLIEKCRRDLIGDEMKREGGARPNILRMLERAADSAHDRRLFELEKMKTLARSARGAAMQARILYEEADGR
jgi:hypothetical protein